MFWGLGSETRVWGDTWCFPKRTNTFWTLPVRKSLWDRISHVSSLYPHLVMSRNDHPCSTQEKTKAQRIQCPARGHRIDDSWTLACLSPKPWLHPLPRDRWIWCLPGPLRASSEVLGAVEIIPLRVYVSVAQLCLILCDPWAVDRQAPLAMVFSRQENWSG